MALVDGGFAVVADTVSPTWISVEAIAEDSAATELGCWDVVEVAEVVPDPPVGELCPTLAGASVLV